MTHRIPVLTRLRCGVFSLTDACYAEHSQMFNGTQITRIQLMTTDFFSFIHLTEQCLLVID